MSGKTADFKVPPAHWDDLAKLDPKDVCRRSLACVRPGYGYELHFLNRNIIVDTGNRCLRAFTGDTAEKIAEKINDPLLLLVVLVYLLNAVDVEPANIMAAPGDLKEGHFFTGVHALDVSGVVEKFGRNIDRFAAAAGTVGGIRQPYADISYRLPALPRVPLYYLLWEGDEEFSPGLSVCFDRTIEHHFGADAIWGLVKRVSRALVKESAL